MAEGSERRFRLLRYNNLKRKSGNKSLPLFLPNKPNSLKKPLFVASQNIFVPNVLVPPPTGNYFLLRGDKDTDNCQRNETEQ
jgi:hypothetical protein